MAERHSTKPRSVLFAAGSTNQTTRMHQIVFTLNGVLDFAGGKPEIAAVNAVHAGVDWCRHHLPERRTIPLLRTRL
jgi:hypothetical protein